jgi:DNA-binding beta-propeller fold protein YncE
VQSALIFIANEEGRSVAVIDSASLQSIGHAAIDGMPTAVIPHPARNAILVLTPATGTVHEVSLADLKTGRRFKSGAPAYSMRPEADGHSVWLLSKETRSLTEVRLDSLRAGRRLRFSAVPEAWDISADRKAVVTFPDAGRTEVWDLASGKQVNQTPTGGKPRTVRFRLDGREVLTGVQGERTLLISDTVTGKPIVRLPLPLEPENLCFKSDGGVLFITGSGADAVTSVYPYRHMVVETVLAGKSPGPMAVSDGPTPLLFVCNPPSGDISVFDIITRKLIAALSVGVEPGHILVTPDNRYAMVLNRKSGDVAVILLDALREKRGRGAPPPLFTLIRVGAGPVSASYKLQS